MAKCYEGAYTQFLCYCERASARVIAQLFAYPPVIVDVLERNTMSQVVDDVSTFARGSSIMSNKKKYQPTHQTFGTKFAPKIQEV